MYQHYNTHQHTGKWITLCGIPEDSQYTGLHTFSRHYNLWHNDEQHLVACADCVALRPLLLLEAANL
jgi:hypothetical protein